LNSKKKNPVIIIGAGGHAKVLLDTLKLIKRNVIGLIAKDIVKGDILDGIKVLGDDQEIQFFSPDKVCLVNGVGSLPGNMLRWKLADKFRNKGFDFSQIIHPAACIAEDVIISQGVQVMAGSVLQPGVKIGEDCIINTGVLIDHDCHISANCHLSPGVTLCGGVRIGKNTHIGAGVTVIQGIEIGDNVIVAAGSVVFRNIKADQKFIQQRKEKGFIQ
jgi:sugar O-acyltransferase (sialic acid O-acetyltransferase NeuD family)